MHVTEFHHIGHESVLREDEDTVLSSKSHVNLPNYLFFLMCVQNRNLNKTKHLFFPLVPKTKISKWISAGKDLCFLSTFVPVLLCYMSAKWSDWVELMDTAAWCFPQRHSLSCFSVLFSWVWCTACCRGALASDPRQPRSSGRPSSRSWSWSWPADWPWGSAPAPTAPRPWAARRASHHLPENHTTQYIDPPPTLFPFIPQLVLPPKRNTSAPPAITHCLRQHHFNGLGWQMCGNRSLWL